ncbi:hypothetical protein IP93_00279 [Lysobacter ruishenii]|uniref:Uncharacterized protein n=1 Tax=Aerolutibacter ruishenii TaxID=686800 RepID=A0A562M2X2_9GAMM|nr:hypothetical protein IP93_00279 [Lysobacter ruishenii]
MQQVSNSKDPAVGKPEPGPCDPGPRMDLATMKTSRDASTARSGRLHLC